MPCKVRHAKSQRERNSLRFIWNVCSVQVFPHAMDDARSFLYGVVALQAGLINSEQFNGFIESSLDWDEARDGPYPALLVQRGWIRASDTPHLEYLVERKLKAHAGDAGASLITINSEVKCSLEALGNPEVRGSKANFSPVKSS